LTAAGFAHLIIGTTHLIVNGKLVSLLKCPFCNLLPNIHVEVIENHIRLTHPKRSSRVSDYYPKGVRGSSPYSPYITKEEIKLPWINCLWCNYRDKIQFDLSLHFLEDHKSELVAIPISTRDRKLTKSLLDPEPGFHSKFEAAIEFRLDVAIEMAKEENRDRGIDHAIREIQRKIIKRRQVRRS
jgi:hypothetical protein